MSRPRLQAATLASFVLGIGLMVPFESTVPLILGIASLFTFIVLGVFLVANPEDLAREEEDTE